MNKNKIYIKYFSFFLLLSCASRSDEKRVLVWEEWKGHAVEELKTHPYFKHLPIKKIIHPQGLQTWLLRDQSRFQSDSYCQSLGGCIGMPIYNCDNAFSVKEDVIMGFEQSGSCPGLKTIEVQKK